MLTDHVQNNANRVKNTKVAKRKYTRRTCCEMTLGAMTNIMPIAVSSQENQPLPTTSASGYPISMAPKRKFVLSCCTPGMMHIHPIQFHYQMSASGRRNCNSAYPSSHPTQEGTPSLSAQTIATMLVSMQAFTRSI